MREIFADSLKQRTMMDSLIGWRIPAADKKAISAPELEERPGLVRSRQWRRAVLALRRLKFLKRLHQMPRQRPDAIEDPVGDGLRHEITGGEHLHSGIEVIDVIERHRLRRLRAHRRTELRLPM